MVGPTWVQAGQVCLADQVFFFVPLASRGSLVQDAVLMKLGAEGIKRKCLAGPTRRAEGRCGWRRQMRVNGINQAESYHDCRRRGPFHVAFT